MRRTRSPIIGTLALVASGWALLHFRSAQRLTRARPAKDEFHRWEGEGGNVPQVAIDKGHQGRMDAPETAIHAAATSTNENDTWQFPHS